MKEDFDFDFEDFGDYEEELDELPKEGTPLYNVMKANGILTSKERRVYERYDQSNLGCAMDRPVLIEETEDYIHLEYEILAYLLRPVPYRFVDYELEEQRLICQDGKYLDALLVRVYTHPLLDMDENGNLINLKECKVKDYVLEHYGKEGTNKVFESLIQEIVSSSN